MSFKNEYKNAVDNIKPDGYIKQKVLNKISHKEQKKSVSKAVIYRTAGALAACMAVVLSVWVINPAESNAPVKSEVKIATYGEIYDVVNKFKPKVNVFYDAIELFSGGATKNSAVDDYEYYVVEESAPTTANGADNATATKDGSFSETTTQVEGVGESDIVKTNGRYIYSFSVDKGALRIIKAGKSPELISTIPVSSNSFNPTSEMYLYENFIVIIGYNGNYRSNKAMALVYDVSNPESPKKLYECSQSGSYSGLWNNSRLIGNKLYLISNYAVNFENINKAKPETYIPTVNCNDYDGAVEAETVYINEVCKVPEYTVISSFDVTSGKLVSTQSVLGGTYTLYCSTENIITAGNAENGKTTVTRFSIDDGKIDFKAEGVIEGDLLNQFSIDEYKGNFRFVTTVSKGKETRLGDTVRYDIDNSNSLVVLDGDLKQIGIIENIAPDERVYSVRFMGEIAYFVTFRQVDPLFSVDLSNPREPKIIGALKIPGFSNYLFPYGEGKLLGIGQDADEQTGRTGDVKLSMFDISNPANVIEGAKAILNASYSDALYSHKAALVESKKNIIAFSVYGNRGMEYRVFSFENGGFVQRALIELNKVDGNVRGLYIGSEFYIVTESSLVVLDINTFEKLTEIEL